MQREAFLDAQLWLRRLSPDDPLLSPPAVSAGQRGIRSLLPPEPLAEASSAPSVSWCCFQLGERFCFFRADEEDQDPTQLQIEISVATPGNACGEPSHVLLRFEKTLVYELDTAAVLLISLPGDLAPASGADASTSQESGRREQPPCGSIRCGAVTLRVWMDPEQTPASDAAGKLRLALTQLQVALDHRGKRVEELRVRVPSWKDTFRHSLHVSTHGTVRSPTSLSEMSPAGFLEKMATVLSTSGDLEAVKMVIDRIVRARRQCAGRNRDRSLSSSQGEVDVAPAVSNDSESKSEEGLSSVATANSSLFSDIEVVVLVTELMHLFGEDHEGINQLLGFTPVDESTATGDAKESSLAACTASKWAAWDTFLEESYRVLMQSRKRKRDNGREGKQEPRTDGRIQLAADSFSRSIVEKDERAQWRRRHRHALARISAMERTAFRALGLLSERGEPDSSASGAAVAAQQRPADQEQQRARMAEQMFAALLHKRRQLVRDELELELLPQRRI